MIRPLTIAFAAALVLAGCSKPEDGSTAYGFDAQVSFTPEAAAALKESHERARITAVYAGGATTLASESVEIDGADQTVHFTGKTLKAADLAKVPSGAITVNAFAESARTTTQQPLLTCSHMGGPMAEVRAAPVQIRCDKATLRSLSSAPYAFDLKLSLSPAALALLERKHEKVIVSAMYYGMPTKAARAQADEMGQINLGNHDSTLMPGMTSFRVEGGLEPDLLPLIEDAPRVLINIYTARLTSEDNLLDCGIFDGTLVEARKAPVSIACKLIYPDPQQGGAQ